jgi:hypothetical protein
MAAFDELLADPQIGESAIEHLIRTLQESTATLEEARMRLQAARRRAAEIVAEGSGPVRPRLRLVEAPKEDDDDAS